MKLKESTGCPESLTIRARESGQPRGARQPDEPNWFIALLFVIIQSNLVFGFFFFPFFDSHLKTPLMKPASLFYTTKCFTLMIQWTRPKAKACRKFPLFSASSYFFKEWFPSSCLKYHNSIILRLKLLHVFAFLHGTISFKVAPAN